MAFIDDITSVTLGSTALKGFLSVDLSESAINREDLTADSYPYPAIVNVAKQVTGSVNCKLDSTYALPAVTSATTLAIVVGTATTVFTGNVWLENLKINYSVGTDNTWEISFDFKTVDGDYTLANA